jgi:transcriptional accessory protein Tex/SPT6
VKVTVMAVDLERHRIALSMKAKPDLTSAGRGAARAEARPDGERRPGGPRAERGNAREGQREHGRRAGHAPVKPPAGPGFVPTSGAVAPNGIRFK